MPDDDDAVAGFYGFLWPFLDASAAEAAWLDEDAGGRPIAEYLPEIPRRHGVGPGATLLDVGCGKGRQVAAFAADLGCRVIGVDPLADNLARASARVRGEGVADRVELLSGSIERLPLPDASVDFVWCRDMFNHVADPARAAAECARVLRPGGRMMNYSALATPWLEPNEAARVAAALGMNLATFDAARMAAAFAGAGLRTLEHGTTNLEDSPFYEAIDEHGGRDAMRLARVLRARRRAIDRVGGAASYERLVGYYLWNVYLLIDKLTYGVWVLQAGPER